MKTKALNILRENHVCTENRRILVGLSGGSDSMALLHLLLSLREELHCSVAAAHVNHGIRGDEADRDEAFVRAFCAQHDVPLHVLHTDIPRTMQETGESGEECGRRIRYEFFSAVDPNALIATAHHLDDSAETFFLNLIRGTGLKGLTGIPPVRGNIIRPLIRCTKQEILDYCSANGVPFVVDRTNFSDDYSRNKIRNQVIPVLQSINPSFLDCFDRSLSILKEDERFLHREAQRYALHAKDGESYSVAALLQTPAELRGRVIALALRNLTGETPEAKHVRHIAAMLEQGGSATINGGKTVQSDGNRLFLQDRSEKTQPTPLIFEQLPDKLYFAGRELHFSRRKIENNSKIIFQYSLNHDRILYPVTVRSKQDGDRFRPAGRNVTKTLKKLFCEQHCTAREKANTIVIADRNGILCVGGFGADERCAADAQTKNILYLTISECSSCITI